MRIQDVCLALFLVPLMSAPAFAQQGTVVGGSNDVLVGGQPAARSGDQTSDGNQIFEGSSSVFINGRPAATTGSQTDCGGMVIAGEGSVLIGGQPAARQGDAATGCPE